MTTATPGKLILHACPRCHGDLIFDIDEDAYGCLQCGFEVARARFEALATIDRTPARAMTPGRGNLRLVPALEEWNDDAA